MFSKNKFSLSLTVLMVMNLLGTVACSRFLDEKREKPQTIEMSNARFACLQALPEEITKFLQGTVSDSDIHSGFDCAKGALIYFNNKTKGTYQDAYTMEDLRNFFGKYFLKKNNVTAEFGHELFKLKQVLIGGSDKFITKAEIQRLVEILDVVRDQAKKVAPHMPTLLAENRNPTWSQVDDATDQLKESVWLLFKQVDVANSSYTFEDLKKFMEGLDNFINASETFYLTQKLSSNVVLVEAAKSVLIGDRNSLNDIHDWHLAVQTVMGVYRETLRYLYFVKDNEMEGLASQKAMVMIAHDALEILEASLPVQRHGAISFASLDKLLDTLADRGLVPMGLSSAALKETYKKVVLRMLDPQRRGDARGLRGLERNHILALKFELRIFELHQEFINSLSYDVRGTVSFDEIQAAVQRFNPTAVIAQRYSNESLEQEGLKQAWSEGVRLLVRDFPTFYNRQGRQVVMGGSSRYRQSWGSLTRWNVMRALSRALLLGYGYSHNSVLSEESMLESGLEQWYTDFNQLGIELKAFDPRSVHSGARSFKEANFFTSTGNGDQFMDFQETFDFVSLLVSGGLESAEYIREAIFAKSCGLSHQDVFGFPWMDEICFKKVLRQNFAEYFNNLPGMVLEVAQMKDPEWNEFYGNLMSAARVSAADGGQVETADLRTAVMILHYTESLMAVYDVNHDGKLNAAEIRAAAPRFLEFMKSVSPVKTSLVVADFFLFMVYKGKKPTVWDYTKFQGEKAFHSLEDVGRDKILRVFKVLKDEAANK